MPLQPANQLCISQVLFLPNSSILPSVHMCSSLSASQFKESTIAQPGKWIVFIKVRVVSNHSVCVGGWMWMCYFVALLLKDYYSITETRFHSSKHIDKLLLIKCSSA